MSRNTFLINKQQHGTGCKLVTTVLYQRIFNHHIICKRNLPMNLKVGEVTLTFSYQRLTYSSVLSRSQ